MIKTNPHMEKNQLEKTVYGTLNQRPFEVLTVIL